MKIWIDNDGCPRIVRDLVLASATRRKLPVTVVGNTLARVPPGPLFKAVCVHGGFDAADDHIAEHVASGDLVITSDVPLAARIVAKGALGLNSHGTVFNPESIGDQTASRNLMQELRGGGMLGASGGGGPPPFGENEKRRFANALEKILDRLKA
ncbi:YaiI/YqxD family protein [bacterium]|nr:YaiI/YqxD family protein [bacterium]